MRNHPTSGGSHGIRSEECHQRRKGHRSARCGEAADIVEDAGHIVKGDIAGGAGAIVQDATDIATHAVEKAKEVFTGKSDAE